MSINEIILLSNSNHQFILVLGIFISLLSIILSPIGVSTVSIKMHPSNVLFQNMYANITVKVLTCNGLTLPSNLPITVCLFENDTKIRECSGTRCILRNVTVGSYTLKVYYKLSGGNKVPVYEGSLTVEENITSLSYDVRANITKLYVSVVDDEDVTLKSYTGKLLLSAYNVYFPFKKDEYLYLPFSNYTLSLITYTLNLKSEKIDYKFSSTDCNLTKPFSIGCTSKIIIHVPVAHKVVFSFFKVSGEPLIMNDIKAQILFSHNGKQYVLKEGFLSSSNSIELFGIPYGKYTVNIFKENNKILTQDFVIGPKNKKIFVYTNIISYVKLKFIDLDGNLLQKYNLSIKTPFKTLDVQTNNLGIVELENVVGGVYYVHFFWKRIIGISLSVDVTNKGLHVVNVPLKTFTLIVKPEFSSTLPKDIEVSIFYKKDGVLIESLTSKDERPEIGVELYQFPIGSEYYVRVRWGNKILSSKRIEVYNNTKVVEIFIPLFDITFQVTDMNDVGLTNASVKVSSPDGFFRHLWTNTEGECKLVHVTEGEYRILIEWKDIQVCSETLRVGRDENRTKIKIRVPVYDLHLEVVGWFNFPLENVQLNAVLILNNVKMKEFNGTSLKGGDIILTKIPLPKGSSLRIILSYKGKTLSDIIVPISKNGIIEKRYFMDVFMDLPWYALSLIETIILFVILVSGLLIAIVAYRKISYKRDISRIFDEKTVESIKAKKTYELEELEYKGFRGFYRHLKDFLEELVHHKKEDENEDLEIFQ